MLVCGCVGIAIWGFNWLGNDELLTVSAIMAMGSILSLLLFLQLPERDGDEVIADDAANAARAAA